mmetsp:Transcript_7751/g.15824  ORF Transcript_7751/g.15824 Transcript_7751/m.15824 type:complete len:364 (-) Transcript_7751:643-1734(-)
MEISCFNFTPSTMATTVVKKLVVVFLYLALNSFLNLLNKWALGVYGFKFPIVMTVMHMTFSFLFLLPIMLIHPSYAGQHQPLLKAQWKGVALIGSFMAINIALNNASLVTMTLSLNQVIRASIPCFTGVFAIFVEKRYPTQLQGMGLAPISMGVMIAVFEGTKDSSHVGITLCVLASISNALMMTISGRVLTQKLDAVRLTFYTAPVSVIVLLPLALYYEWSAFQEFTMLHTHAVAGILIGGSCVALSYNMVHNLMIQLMSATTTCVLGNVKVILLLFLSSALFGDTRNWTMKLAGGCCLTLAGFFIYSWGSLARNQLPAASSTAFLNKITVPGSQPSSKEGDAGEPLLPVCKQPQAHASHAS